MNAELTGGEREFMEIYRHFKTTDGQSLLPQNISAVGSEIMSPANYKQVNEIADALVARGFITDKLALTKAGEEYLYPQVSVGSLTQGEAEFMEIYRHFKATEGHSLLPQNISAAAPQIMAPVNYKRVNEIADALAARGFITDKLALTKEGEQHLYS